MFTRWMIFLKIAFVHLASSGLGCVTQAFLVVICGLICSAACGILTPPLGIEPASPASQGRFLNTGPPGKSPRWRVLMGEE